MIGEYVVFIFLYIEVTAFTYNLYGLQIVNTTTSVIHNICTYIYNPYARKFSPNIQSTFICNIHTPNIIGWKCKYYLQIILDTGTRLEYSRQRDNIILNSTRTISETEKIIFIDEKKWKGRTTFQ